LGYSELDRVDLLGVCHETLSRCWTAYAAEGLDCLPGGRSGRPVGTGRLLSEQQAQRIQGCIDHHRPEELGIPSALWARRAVRDLVRKEFRIDLTQRTVGEYLRRGGDTAKQPGRHSRKQGPDEVEQWLEETYPAIEEQAEREDAEILWADEVGVDADHQPGGGYARKGEPATRQTPPPPIRVNPSTAISNEGTVRFMTYKGSFNFLVLLLFLSKLSAGASRKVLLSADQLQAHKTPAVLEGRQAYKDKIEVFYLPTYAPELNPVEYRNKDVKSALNKAGLPDKRGTLHARILSFREHRANVPKQVISYFLNPWVQYAAPVELL
jgi:transposase